ncbi:MAG: Glu-tRNA(Gln) amidotransferase subunit GatD [Candidatus Hadarchaeales archaeon]
MSGYRGAALRLIKRASADVGDLIFIETGGQRYEGVLMPRSGLAESEHIVIKLRNGYNIGVRADKRTKMGVIEKGKPPSLTMPVLHGIEKKGNPVTIIGTGGTIASRVDYRTGAVYPAFTPQEIYTAVPELADIAEIRALEVCNVFSEHMTPDLWVKIGRAVAREIRRGASGVVVAHGTDTMGYTAAALSFMLGNLYRPVVMVGSQRSSDRPSSDASLNLISAVNVAANSDIAEVTVVMHGSMDDDRCLIHRGTKVRKCHTSRRDAFLSVNDLPLGSVSAGKIEMMRDDYNHASKSGNIRFMGKFEKRVVLLKATPGFPSDLMERMIKAGCRGFVIEGTGLGHVPESMFRGIRRAAASGVPVVMTSQCLWGRVNMKVYSTGRDLLDMGVIPGDDMLPETAWVKLMWVLGQTRKISRIIEMMQKNIAGEKTQRSVPESYEPRLLEGS